MLDLRGTELADDELELLRHPRVGGVILFSRNYRDPDQIRQLCGKIHDLRNPPLLIGIDHEGGRVQRFHDAFTPLPACHCYGEIYDDDAIQGVHLAEQAGWLMAAELLAVGVDFSFAPVLDLDKGISHVIGDRAFHRNPDSVTILAKAFMKGMKLAGMAAVGKHFPGHGAVKEDSHVEIPVDARRFDDIYMSDIIPFERMILSGLPAVMPAHVIYPEVDHTPAGFSRIWLQEILRQRLGFQGVIFSDDISMAGAEHAGDYPERVMAALGAGCDMVLICNNQAAAVDAVNRITYEPHPVAQARLMRMHGRSSGMDFYQLKQDQKWQSIAKLISSLDQTPELGLGDDEIKS
jgi:beta-N-acetylhexosaminidase